MSDTLFKQVNYDLDSLVKFIELGQIGLPDIQRPFVWPNRKVRDLFDSMYRGYPVGYLLFWQNGFSGDTKQIGTDAKQKVPDLLIVDGQQRLTSLFAVTRGIPVLRENGEAEAIQIAFNPLQEQFEVADAAVRKDKAYISNISSLWAKDASLFEVVGNYLRNLRDTREVATTEQQHVEKAITRLFNLLKFPFTALELSKNINEEQVAEVFVRINSKGKPLNQADFILTLMSVFWDEGRKELEGFCARARKPSTGTASPFNHYIQPDPDQLLRVSIALGFKRARLQYVYSILRGKDLETGEFSDERREQQFGVLKDAQAKVLDLTAWHDFFHAVRAAGYLGGRMITSNNNLLFAYAFFLIGKTEYSVPQKDLRRVIARWFFMCSLTGRYTGSPESDLEFDLARLREVKDAADFCRILDQVCDAALTSDFWAITLPNDLATSSPRSPSLFAYHAALVLEEARALFSDQRVEALLDPSVHSTRSAAERHHLFPKAYLKTLGTTDLRETNQIANYALLEWGDNGDIGATAPASYLPVMKARTKPDELVRQYRWHALPDGWESMPYKDFLAARRERIARFVMDAYSKLRDGAPSGREAVFDIEELIRGGEGLHVEFKATLRVNLHTGERDSKMERAVLKTIAGFLNSHGGTLIIGVSDDGETLGVESDGFASEDKMHLHLVNLLKDRVGAQMSMYIHPRFEDRDDHRVLVIECWRANSAAFVKDGDAERFYVRTGAATTELTAKQAQEYIAQRFLARQLASGVQQAF
jgi:hypothetical protein